MLIQVRVVYECGCEFKYKYYMHYRGKLARCTYVNSDAHLIKCAGSVQHNIEIITVAACILAFLCRCIKLLARNVTSNDTQSQKNMKKKKKKMIKPTLLGNEYDFGNANANGVATRINKKTSIRIKPTLLGERSIMPGRDLDENDIHRLWNGKKRKTT